MRPRIKFDGTSIAKCHSHNVGIDGLNVVIRDIVDIAMKQVEKPENIIMNINVSLETTNKGEESKPLRNWNVIKFDGREFGAGVKKYNPKDVGALLAHIYNTIYVETQHRNHSPIILDIRMKREERTDRVTGLTDDGVSRSVVDEHESEVTVFGSKYEMFKKEIDGTTYSKYTSVGKRKLIFDVRSIINENWRYLKRKSFEQINDMLITASVQLDNLIRHWDWNEYWRHKETNAEFMKHQAQIMKILRSEDVERIIKQLKELVSLINGNFVNNDRLSFTMVNSHFKVLEDIHILLEKMRNRKEEVEQ